VGKAFADTKSEILILRNSVYVKVAQPLSDENMGESCGMNVILHTLSVKKNIYVKLQN
jgi:hypothetical protein